MTAETAPRQPEATRGGPAEPGPARPSNPQSMEGMARYGIWLAVMMHLFLHNRRFQASVITGTIGVYGLFSVIKNNQHARCGARSAGTTRDLLAMDGVMSADVTASIANDAAKLPTGGDPYTPAELAGRLPAAATPDRSA